MLSQARVRTYLDRIGYDGPLERSLETLRALHRAHVFSVPFENLDIHLGRHMPVDLEHAEAKIVGRNRGGYCYEINPLFHALLTSLGFEASIHAAKLLLRGTGDPFDHVMIVAHLDEDWLVDPGFGRPPPPLGLDREDQGGAGDETGTFQIVRRGEEYVLTGSKAANSRDYEDLFAFEPVPRALDEFGPRSDWTQSSPESVFTKAPFCSMPVDGRRVTISGLNRIESGGGKIERRQISPEERDALLKGVFGIDLGGAELREGTDSNFMPGRSASA